MQAPTLDAPSRRFVLAGIGALIGASRAHAAPFSVPDAPPPFQSAGEQFTLIEPAVAAPAIRLDAIKGAPLDLPMLRGKAVLINFWASWYPPCVRELPLLERLRGLTRSEPLEIIAISIDAAGRERVTAFLKRLAIEHLPVYLDPAGRLARKIDGAGVSPFVLYGMPMSYVMDRAGRIAGYLTGQADWTSAEGLRLLRYYANT
jgi:thiol-disulfide isomerase/thioredoxin